MAAILAETETMNHVHLPDADAPYPGKDEYEQQFSDVLDELLGNGAFILDHDVILSERAKTTRGTRVYKDSVRPCFSKAKGQNLKQVTIIQQKCYGGYCHVPTFFISRKKAEEHDRKFPDKKFIDSWNAYDEYFLNGDGPFIRANSNCRWKDLEDNGGKSRKRKACSKTESVQLTFDLQCPETLDNDAQDVIDRWIDSTKTSTAQTAVKEKLAFRFRQDIASYKKLIVTNPLELDPHNDYDEYRQKLHESLIVDIANSLGNAMITWCKRCFFEGTHSKRVSPRPSRGSGSGRKGGGNHRGHGSSEGNGPDGSDGGFYPWTGGSDGSGSSSTQDNSNSSFGDSGTESGTDRSEDLNDSYASVNGDSDAESDSGGSDGYDGAATMRTSTTESITSSSSGSEDGDTDSSTRLLPSSDACDPDDEERADELFSPGSVGGTTSTHAQLPSPEGYGPDGEDHKIMAVPPGSTSSEGRADDLFSTRSEGGSTSTHACFPSREGYSPDGEERENVAVPPGSASSDVGSCTQLLAPDYSIPGIEDSTDGFFWFWYGNRGEFLPFDDSIMLLLEVSRRRGNDQIKVLLGNDTYTINLKDLVQTNERSGYSRPICKRTALWHWKDDDGQTWKQYNREDSLQLALANLSVQDKNIRLFHGSHTYDVDLDRQVQHNILTGREREIRSGILHSSSEDLPTKALEGISDENHTRPTKPVVLKDAPSMSTLPTATRETSLPFAVACVVKPSDPPSTDYALSSDLAVDSVISDFRGMNLTPVSSGADGTQGSSVVCSQDSATREPKQ